MAESLILIDFRNETIDPSEIYILDDGVMGGRSQGHFEIRENDCLRFWGEVSLENNGGFSSVRIPMAGEEVNEFSKFRITLRGDGKNYQFRVRSSGSERFSYQFIFHTNGEWQTVEIPFNEMIPTFRGYRLDRDPYPGRTLSELTFLVSNKKAESFDLKIRRVAVE